MKMKIVEDKQDFLLVEIDGEDQSIINVLTETLNKVDGVMYAGYRIEHPLTNTITLSIKVNPSKTTPRKALAEAFKELGLIVKRLEEEIGRMW
jgi:DNA-directed RNA polymerase subunit L